MLFHIQSDGSTLVALGTSYKTQMAGLAQTATLRRGKVTEVSVGPFDNPGATDCNFIYTIMRQTAADGTAGGTPVPLYVPAIEAGTAPAAGSLWKDNYSAEPTITALSYVWGPRALNQHSGFIWYAPDEIGVPWPAVNNNGLAFRAKGASSTVSGFTATVIWEAKFQE